MEKTVEELRQEFTTRHQERVKRDREVIAEISATCPKLNCILCDYAFNGEQGDTCPNCGKQATFKHILRVSARI